MPNQRSRLPPANRSESINVRWSDKNCHFLRIDGRENEKCRRVRGYRRTRLCKFFARLTVDFRAATPADNPEFRNRSPQDRGWSRMRPRPAPYSNSVVVAQVTRVTPRTSALYVPHRRHGSEYQPRASCIVVLSVAFLSRTALAGRT